MLKFRKSAFKHGILIERIEQVLSDGGILMVRSSSDEKEKRHQKVREAALESIAKRGQFNFRLEGADIKRLYSISKKKKRPVSSMVREWVLDRLEKEEGKKVMGFPPFSGHPA